MITRSALVIFMVFLWLIAALGIVLLVARLFGFV